MPGIVLIDAYSQIYRLFYAVRMLNDSQGQPVNALFGMARLFMQFEQQFPSELGAIAFDKGKPARRMELCPEYKAQRPPMPAELRSQIAPIQELANAFGWPILIQEGLEADDIIAAIARRRGNATVSIITHDKDIAQLTQDGGVAIFTPEGGDKWRRMDSAGTRERFGVGPELLGDYLALVGDTADNIAGVPGIGPKTAASILNQYGDLEKLLENTDAIDNRRIAEKLRDNADLIRRNRKLVALDDVLPEGCSIPEGIQRRRPDWGRVLELAQERGFKSLYKEVQRQLEQQSQGTFF